MKVHRLELVTLTFKMKVKIPRMPDKISIPSYYIKNRFFFGWNKIERDSQTIRESLMKIR